MIKPVGAIIAIFVAGSAIGGCSTADKTHLQGDTAKLNYSIGYQVGDDLRKQGVQLDSDSLLKGVRDSASARQPEIPADEMRLILVNLKKKIDAEDEARRQKNREQYRGEGREFLLANSVKKGVVTLPSGLQYQILREGSGKSPTLKDAVIVNYLGTRLDGREFDSSYRDGTPLTIPLAKVIPGWQEALPLMKEGAKWRLFIPADLAFGERGPLADQTVIYEIELLEVKAGQ